MHITVRLRSFLGFSLHKILIFANEADFRVAYRYIDIVNCTSNRALIVKLNPVNTQYAFVIFGGISAEVS